ncbi:hypothetical protein BT93_L0838 [Corymbia citriodora subsp. variegata]|uniref:Uncharacterized protein n=1 Tax=Corymbia citriodora subsp. variegata TaxID=360336 RepID=A0A8T0CI22_CORYI|nr:hypothetical protein BT93_L0838 [Corymbia citriodora subsp. variegata]
MSGLATKAKEMMSGTTDSNSQQSGQAGQSGSGVENEVNSKVDSFADSKGLPSKDNSKLNSEIDSKMDMSQTNTDVSGGSGVSGNM